MVAKSRGKNTGPKTNCFHRRRTHQGPLPNPSAEVADFRYKVTEVYPPPGTNRGPNKK